MKRFNDYVAVYIRTARKRRYSKSIRWIAEVCAELKIVLIKKISGKYSFGNTSLGYIDFVNVKETMRIRPTTNTQFSIMPA